MTNETVRHGYAQDAMPNSQGMRNVMRDDSKGMIREQQIDKFLQTQAREDDRAPKSRKRITGGPLSRRWSRRMDFGEAYRAPSHFTWRC